MEAAVDTYAQAMGEVWASIWSGLAPILAYERLIGVAEDHELEPIKARTDREDLVRLAGCHPALRPLAGPSAALRAALPAEDLPQ